MANVGMIGRSGPLPFAGHLRGGLWGPRSGVVWAGSLGGPEPVSGWECSRALEGALRTAGLPSGDRRRILSVLWARTDAIAGAHRAADLALLLVAWDPEGFAVSGTGLGGLFAVGPHVDAVPWVVGAHPLLGPPGFPSERPGALTVEQVPPWLVAVRSAEPRDLAGQSLRALLPRCGVHQ